mmetsp:Transcript_18040/g.52629  ORF Transcript_18040/g.52629 Transcript_18040/m.52629 type:complete len:210 (+) Transcript_18040:6141-6770(+)
MPRGRLRTRRVERDPLHAVALRDAHACEGDGLRGARHGEELSGGARDLAHDEGDGGVVLEALASEAVAHLKALVARLHAEARARPRRGCEGDGDEPAEGVRRLRRLAVHRGGARGGLHQEDLVACRDPVALDDHLLAHARDELEGLRAREGEGEGVQRQACEEGVRLAVEAVAQQGGPCGLRGCREGEGGGEAGAVDGLLATKGVRGAG